MKRLWKPTYLLIGIPFLVRNTSFVHFNFETYLKKAPISKSPNVQFYQIKKIKNRSK